MEPVPVVDLTQQLFDPAGAVLTREELARRAATELQARSVEPFGRRPDIAEHADCEIEEIGWVVSMHVSG